MSVKPILQRRKKWDKRFLELAKTVSEWSLDPSTKVGSVISTDDNRVLSVGYNGFPKNVEDKESRYRDRATKLKLVCHAERNALDSSHFDVSGATLYSTLFTCNECAKSVIQRGIQRVVSPTPVLKDNPFNWEESLLMYKEAGIKVSFVDPDEAI